MATLLSGPLPYITLRRFPGNAPTQGRTTQVDHSASFARHFAHLVWLILNEVANVDDQKMALRALVILSKSGAVSLVAQEGQLRANDGRVALPLTGVRELLDRMTAHSLERIDVAGACGAADLIGLARILAGDATPGDGGTGVREQLASLTSGRITVVTAAPAPATVSSEAPTVITPLEQPKPAARAAQDAAALIEQVVATDVSKLTPEELFGRLDRAKTPQARADVLEDLMALAEHAARVAKPAVVASIIHEVIVREGRVPDDDAKKVYTGAIRRLAKPALLRSVATLVPKRPEKKQQYYEILSRAGEDGADALIEQISQATTTKDRRQFMEVFQELDTAVPALIRMLGDSRWFVVRNAADLLGELGARPAEAALIQLLRHTDERVRRAATTALTRLGTPDATKAIYDAVNDASPEVRIQAAAAMSTRRDARTSNTLIRAIEDEQDNDVQLALVAALGRVATPEAIQKLVRMAEPEGRLFRKKDVMLRVAAVQALGEARTPAAVNALRELASDKDREVRETAARALLQVR